jgi:cell wall-associated NlpC family hydrolase
LSKIKITLLYLLIAIQVFAGCSVSQEASSEVSQEQAEALINERYKNKAVAIETVVDIFKEADINSERITQSLFNQPVTILEEIDGWFRVETIDGSTGWLRSKFVDRDCTSVKKELYTERIVITGKKKTVYTNYGGGATLKDVSMGTEFFVKDKKKNYYEVIVPGKLTGWVEKKDTILIGADSAIPITSAEDFAATVEKFRDTQYLLGGSSAWQGVDGSGVAYISARINGIELPRNILDQFEYIKDGLDSVDDLEPGDLIFFSANEDLADVSDIGIYVGNDYFIYANKAKGCIDRAQLHSDYYMKRIKGIRQIFLKEKP